MEGKPSLTIDKTSLLCNEIPCYRRQSLTIEGNPYYRRKCLTNNNKQFMETPYYRKKSFTNE